MNNSTLRMERAIVASIMLDPGYALPVVNKRLTADEFADEFSRSVLAIYQEAHDSGEPMDPVLLYDKVEAMGMAFDVEQQIRELLTMATARNVEAYCDEVKPPRIAGTWKQLPRRTVRRISPQNYPS